MKRILAAAFCFFLAFGMVYAQTSESTADTTTDAAPAADTASKSKDYDDKTVKVITPQNQHTTDKTASVRIEYTPMYDEVRIFYSCMYVTYDKGEAMNTILACLQDFMKENQYFHYTYLSRDRERYFKNDRGYNMAEYMSYVKFTR